MELLLYVSIGTLAMLIPILIQGRLYRISWMKCVAAAVLLAVCGTVSTQLMFMLENLKTGGLSFFGAVFFVPAFMIPVGKFLKISYGKLMDLCATGECAMLAVMKIPCLLTGCCSGRVITLLDSSFTFPSQIVEMINALILCALLLYLSCGKKKQGEIYPLYMITYGVTRFFLNMGRQEWVDRVIPLPFGNVWSLVSITIGLVSLRRIRRKREQITEVPTVSEQL